MLGGETVNNNKIKPSSNSISLDSYEYPKNLNNAILLIKDAVSGEKEDEAYYNYLISIAPSKEAKDIINTIKENEAKHNKIFRMIYFQITNEQLPHENDFTFEKPSSFCTGLKQALRGELSAIERYRKILFAMQDRVHINMLTEIITDEIRHSAFYNYLISMYC